jgi:hypothetical protein
VEFIHLGYSREKKASSALFCRVEPGKIKIMGFQEGEKKLFWIIF